MDARQILSGLGWSTLATAVSAACQIAFMAAFARLLDPATFGLMAMAGLALRCASYFSQLGFAQALIQRPQLETADTTAALAMAVALGGGFYVATVAAAPLFAAGLRTPELTPLIRVLALTLPLSTLAALPLALLRRQARFKRVNAIEVGAFLIGYGGVGIACASRSLGVWSLVAATLSQQAIVAVSAFGTSRFPLEWPVRRTACRRLWHYGSRQSLIGFLEFLHGNVETLFVGRALGQVPLGLLNRAGSLTSLPVELGVTAVNKVLFPVLAGLQQDRARLADGFQLLLLSVGLSSAALACGIGAAAPDLVALVLGPKWFAIAPLVAIVALSVPPAFMYVACGVTMDCMDVLGPKLALQAAMLALKVGLVIVIGRWGLVGVAWAVVAAEAARLAWGLRLLARLLALAPRRLAGLAGLSAGLGAAVWTVVAAAAAAGVALGLPVAVRVVGETLAGAATMAAALLVLAWRWRDFAPLQRFDSLRRWHARLSVHLRTRAALP